MNLRITYVFLWIITASAVCFAQDNIQELKAVIKQKAQTDTKTYISSLLELCWQYRFSYPDSARMYGEQALAESRKNKLDHLEVEALHYIAVTYEAQADYSQALLFNEKALALRYKLGEQEKTADTEMNRGTIYDAMGNYAKALEYYTKAYNVYKKLGKEDKLLLVNINLGILYKAQGKYSQVISFYKEAYNLAQNQSLEFEKMVCEANLGSVYLITHQYDSAMYFSLLAEKGFNKIKNYQSLPVVHSNIGLAYMGLRNLTLAEKYFKQSLVGHQQFKNKKEQSYVQIELARLYKQQKKTKAAIAALNNALKLAQESGVMQQQIDAHNMLSEIYAQANEHPIAYTHLTDYVRLKDSVYKKESATAMENFLAQYETEKKEQQISIQNLELERRNLYMVILVSLLTLVSFAAYIIYVKRKQREEKLLQQAQEKLQDERVRISRELHDNIGSHLTFINTAMNGISRSGADEEKIQQVRELTSETIKELRKTVWLINKPSVSAAEFAVKLMDIFKNIPGIKVELSGDEDLQLSASVVTQLFRVVQEGVNNALKYSGAHSVVVSFLANKGGLSVSICDNGKGFDVYQHSDGFGLSNMKHRLNAVGGRLDIKSEIGGGTCIDAWVPVDAVLAR